MRPTAICMVAVFGLAACLTAAQTPQTAIMSGLPPSGDTGEVGTQASIPLISPPQASAGVAAVALVGSDYSYGIDSSQCSSACFSSGYNVVWDGSGMSAPNERFSLTPIIHVSLLAGQIVFAPKATANACDTFFGFIDGQSTPPPDGSGTILLYDLMQNQYVGTYSPGSLVVSTGPCTYYFAVTQANPTSGDGLYKLVLDDQGLLGSTCPEAGSTPCYKDYWATVSADGVLAFVDAGAGSCPAFFALAGPGSDGSQGTLTVVGVSTKRATAWAPPGYGGAYTAAAGTVTLRAPGCAGTYKIDSTSAATLVLPVKAPIAYPGAATLSFVGATAKGAAACPVDCFEKGYNVIWDASGEPPPHLTSDGS